MRACVLWPARGERDMMQHWSALFLSPSLLSPSHLSFSSPLAGLSVSVNRTAEREEELSRQLSEQQLELASLNEGLEGVALLVGLQSEAEQLLARAKIGTAHV